MASVKEIEKQISELKDIVKGLNNATAELDGTYTYKGKKYSLKQLQTLESTAKKDITTLTKVIKPVVDARKSIKSLSATGDPFTKMTPQQKAMVKKAEKKLSTLESKDYEIPKLSSVATPATGAATKPAAAVTSPTQTPTGFGGMSVQQGKLLAGTEEVAPVTRATTTRNVVTKTKTRQDYRNSFIAIVNKEKKANWKTVNQYINAGKNAKEKAARKARWDKYVSSNNVPVDDKTPTPVDATDQTGTTPGTTTEVDTDSEPWKKNIQEEFGSLWDVYNEDAEVKKVIDLSVKEGWYNDPVKLTEKLRNTNWFRTTESSARQYAIAKSTDPATAEADKRKRIEYIRAGSLALGVTLSDATIDDLSEKSLKFGWTDQQITNGIGSEAVATANRGGAQGLADLRRGTTGTGLREIADNYGIKVSDTMLDQWTAEILQGTKTNVQFTDQMKVQASTMYRSLAPQIEKGIDVKTATSMYTNTAASVLGVDPATIDWSQDKWNKALNYQDPKTTDYRQMDSWEWNRYLRSLPEWQETNDAKQTYRRAAFTLAQAFGKTS
jgi:hypothetical protein